MEEEKNIEELETETETEETSPETQEETEVETEEVETEEAPQDIDYKQELESKKNKQPKTEAEKAKTALYHNAERAKELGIDPAEVLGLKKTEDTPKEETVKETVDIDAALDHKLAKRDLKAMCASTDEYELAEWYMDNKGLDAEEAYILANKGRIERSVAEAKRANVHIAQPSSGGEKRTQVSIPELPVDQQQILQRRGYSFDPKTKSWKGKYYETYFDRSTKQWESRKLTR